jgi:hypothetical protein
MYRIMKYKDSRLIWSFHQDTTSQHQQHNHTQQRWRQKKRIPNIYINLQNDKNLNHCNMFHINITTAQ